MCPSHFNMLILHPSLAVPEILSSYLYGLTKVLVNNPFIPKKLHGRTETTTLLSTVESLVALHMPGP